MKHRVTIETETKKHFLGIPYAATEKKHIMVDGKTWRKMKREQQKPVSDVNITLQKEVKSLTESAGTNMDN